MVGSSCCSHWCAEMLVTVGVDVHSVGVVVFPSTFSVNQTFDFHLMSKILLTYGSTKFFVAHGMTESNANLFGSARMVSYVSSRASPSVSCLFCATTCPVPWDCITTLSGGLSIPVLEFLPHQRHIFASQK